MRKPAFRVYSIRPVSRPGSRETGLEVSGIPVPWQTGHGWKSLKVCQIDWNFDLSQVVFSKDKRHLPVKTGPVGKGGKGRVERVQEMGKTVENVLGIRDGIQVDCSFHTGVKEMEYKDLPPSPSHKRTTTGSWKFGGQISETPSQSQQLDQNGNVIYWITFTTCVENE